MISSPWRKVLRDFWENKKRTSLVILSIMVSLIAVGAISHMYLIVSQDLVRNYEEVNPAGATIYTVDSFDDELVRVIRRMPEVQAAEGRRSIVARFKHNANQDWFPLELITISDYENIQVNIVRSEDEFGPNPTAWPAPGVWPPPERSLLMERTSLIVPAQGLTSAVQGDSILVELPNKDQRELPMAGLVYDSSRPPATTAGMAYGYIDFDTLEWLGYPRSFNELHIVVARQKDDETHILQVANAVRAKIERGGFTVLRTEVHQPGKLPMDAQFRALTAILGILGVMTVLLSAFLVINMISAMLAQQIRQIGVMKALGARPHQLLSIYLGMILLSGLIALILAMPLALVLAQQLTNFMAYFINFKMIAWRIPWQVFVLNGTLALVVPLAAALIPILNGTRITVREAMDTVGSQDNQFSTFFSRLLEQIQSLPRPVLLALRNTFRRTGRLSLTLITLALAGCLFMSVISVRKSLMVTLDKLLAVWQYNVEVHFARDYRIDQIEYISLGVPGVIAAESWTYAGVYRLRDDDSESKLISLTALPGDTAILQPTILQGRWLHPEDTNAIVVNPNILEAEPDLALGDELVMKLGDKESTWHIIGVAQTDIGSELLAYVNSTYFAQEANQVGVADSVQIVTTHDEAEFEAEIAKKLENAFESQGMNVASTRTVSMRRSGGKAYINLIVIFLLVMAVLLAVVGGFSLMGTMSINVLERTREIGVARAIGASDGTVLRIFMVEGMFIGVISWGIGLIFALPVGQLLTQSVGTKLLQSSVSYVFALEGMGLWLILVVLLASIATYLPAKDASRLSVRETLAYE